MLRKARPRSDLDDGCDRACARARAHLAQTFPETALELVALRANERELTAFRLSQREQLQAQGENRCGELCELRPECRPQCPPLHARLAERQRSTPRAPADQSRRQRDLADLSPAALGTREDPVEQCRERPPEGQLVADRLGKLQPLRDLCGRPPGTHPTSVFTPRQAPGVPA